MTKAQRNYTDPFRRDYSLRVPPTHRCSICTEPATVAIVSGEPPKLRRFCKEHNPNLNQEVTDVREVRESD